MATVVHYFPGFREKTYCGLDPFELVDGRPSKVTDMRGKVTCEECKGLPKD